MGDVRGRVFTLVRSLQIMWGQVRIYPEPGRSRDILGQDKNQPGHARGVFYVSAYRGNDTVIVDGIEAESGIVPNQGDRKDALAQRRIPDPDSLVAKGAERTRKIVLEKERMQKQRRFFACFVYVKGN